eukprot:70057_1
MSLIPSGLVALVLSLLSISCESGLFDEIPAHLRNQIFSSFLDLKQRVRCIASLNRDCHNYYNHTHGKQVHDMKQLEQWFDPPQTTSHLDEIRDMMQSLKFSELLSLHLPTLLTGLHERWQDFSISNEDLVQTLHAMELRPLGMHEFLHNLTSLPCPVPLLLLSSRALINYYIPNYFANSDKENAPMVGLCHTSDGAEAIESFQYWTNYPWLRPDVSDDDPHAPAFDLCIFQTEHWVHYMTHLYEFCFTRITHGPLNSLFHLDGSVRDMFKTLIDHYGFVAWNKASVEGARSSSYSCNLYEIYMDFVRVQRELALSPEWYTNYDVPFRMYLMLNLDEQDACVYGYALQKRELKSQILYLYFESWMYKKNVEREKEKLLRMVIRMYDKNDEAVLDILQPYYNSTSFTNHFVYALWHSEKSVYFDRYDEMKQLVIDAIVSKSKYYWFVELDKQKADDEISKLADDERLLGNGHLHSVLLAEYNAGTDPQYLQMLINSFDVLTV